jgi:hypothetical protein
VTRLQQFRKTFEAIKWFDFFGISENKREKDRAGRNKMYYSIFVPEGGDMWPVRLEVDRGESRSLDLFRYFDTVKPNNIEWLLDVAEAAKNVAEYPPWGDKIPEDFRMYVQRLQIILSET